MKTSEQKAKEKRISHWTREQASNMEYDETNTFPLFNSSKVKPLMKEYHIWDSWFIMDQENEIAYIEGYKIFIALGRKADGSTKPKLMYFYSKDDLHYKAGGNVFEENLVPDSEEWSGSTIYRKDGKVQFFYTVSKAFHDEETGTWQSDQFFATAILPITINENGVQLGKPTYHYKLAEPDGSLYQTVQQTIEFSKKFPCQHNLKSGNDLMDNYCFRDPHYFHDLKTDKHYLFFEACTGNELDAENTIKRDYIGRSTFEPDYQPTVDDLNGNGCIGVAEFTNDILTDCAFHEPLLTANLVSDEIERINVIHKDGKYYLYTTCHGNKMSIKGNDLENRDFLIGFYSDELFGKYVPLNGTGLVLTQKSHGPRWLGQETNHQYAYSYLVLPDNTVISYASYSTLNEGEPPVAIKTAAPTIQLDIKGDKTKIIGMVYNILPEE
ncbi:glycoside hydrolase family 68 protein [Pelosinus baikalensis]|uniref:Glycoside hydrolase family 68 protein n=1 Tax=Pelosinus baikalensis TaxID=2892015 RepID=A0ABS8HZN8_9FIRM|nr:glycoside hydrolase family 68 protein [Pelosinus baikalensis]MCC5467582.1 glycoside hydrolase family 68 protein [Pelosinus baikalensis]